MLIARILTDQSVFFCVSYGKALTQPHTHTHALLRPHACSYYGNCHNTSPCISHIIAWQMRAAERRKGETEVWCGGEPDRKRNTWRARKWEKRKERERSGQVKEREEMTES